VFHFDVPGHDAYCIAAALAGADRDGSLEGWLKPKLAPGMAGVEGWISGVG